MPDPISTAMWSVWVEINPQTAGRLGIGDGDVVEIASAHGAIRAPALISPGIAPDVLAMPVGQGHETFTRYASGRGSNPVKVLGPSVVAGNRRPRLGGDPREDHARQRARRRTDPVCRRRSPKPSTRTAEKAYGTPLGHGRRSGSLHGMRGVRGRVSRREQHPDRRRRRGGARPRHALAARRTLLGRRVPRRPAEVPARALPAVRRGAVRARVPDVREPPHRRRPERAGVQPLHRDPLLRQRLLVQRPVLQLLQPASGRSRSICSSTRTSPSAKWA